MPDEAGAGSATGGASTDAQPQAQDTAGAAQGSTGQGGGGGPAAVPGVSDRSPAAMLAEAVAAGDGQGEGDEIDPSLEPGTVEYWKARAQQWEKRAQGGGHDLRTALKEARAEARKNAEKAKNFDAYTESQKTEQQRLADRAAEAERRAAEAEARYHRTLAAAQYDLPPSLIDHLHGSTEEEINARAEDLAAAINERAAVLAAAQAQAGGQQQQPRNGAGFRPVESLRPGALPASDSKPQDPNAWLRAALTKQK